MKILVSKYDTPLNCWDIYKALQRAAKESNNEDVRFVAEAILADGSPSAIGYVIDLPNEYYMTNFIKIVTNNLS